MTLKKEFASSGLGGCLESPPDRSARGDEGRLLCFAEVLRLSGAGLLGAGGLGGGLALL